MCFAANFEANLVHSHIGKTEYVYEPDYGKLTEKPCKIFSEVTQAIKSTSGDPWIDFEDTREHRFYRPVPVKIVGEIYWGDKGVDIYIAWYKTWYKKGRMFVSVWDGILEIIDGKRRTIRREQLPWNQKA